MSNTFCSISSCEDQFCDIYSKDVLLFLILLLFKILQTLQKTQQLLL